MLTRFMALVLLLIASEAAGQPRPKDDKPLNPEEIRIFVSGKTVREYSNGQLIRLLYYAPDGRAYMVRSGLKGDFSQASAGRWEVKDHYLCRPDFVLGRPCQPMNRHPDGSTILYYGASMGRVTLSATEGDPDQLVAFTEKYIAAAPDRVAAAAEARRGAMPPGRYLTGDEIRALVAGKTTRERPTERLPSPAPPILVYFAEDGTGYLASSDHQTFWRGPWVIKGDRLCLDGAYWPCAAFRRAHDSTIMKEYGGPRGTRSLELLDGDPEKVLETVSNSRAYKPGAQNAGKPKANQPAFLGNTTVR